MILYISYISIVLQVVYPLQLLKILLVINGWEQKEGDY